MEYFCNTPQSTFDLDKLPKWTSADDKTSPGFTSKDYFGQTNMHEKARMASGFGLLSAFGLPNVNAIPAHSFDLEVLGRP
jgi:hypothetical protein